MGDSLSLRGTRDGGGTVYIWIGRVPSLPRSQQVPFVHFMHTYLLLTVREGMGERVGRVTQTRGPRNRVQSEMHCIAFIISFDLWSIRAISIYPGRSARTLNFPANLPTYLPTGEISNTRLRVSAGNQDIPSREELTSIHPLGRGADGRSERTRAQGKRLHSRG